jgi:hypothetical protein
MKKSNLYEIDVLLVKNQRSEKHVLYVAARNVKNAFSKASARLAQTPHGYDRRYWKLTGYYKPLGKVFI